MRMGFVGYENERRIVQTDKSPGMGTEPLRGRLTDT
jgi:hypothetical protein